MCLFKKDGLDNSCNHEECKYSTLLNQQRHFLSLAQSQQTNLLVNPNNHILFQTQSQHQAKPLLLQSIQNPSPSIQSLNGKRPFSPNGSHHENVLIDKKVKIEHSSYVPSKYHSASEETNASQSYEDNLRSQFSSLNQISPFMANNQIGNPLLNNLLTLNAANTMTGNIQSENSFASFNNNNMILQAQNNIALLNNAQNQSILQSQQNGSIAQLLAQAAVKGNPTLGSSPMEIRPKTEGQFSIENFFKDFQTKVFGLICTQNKMLGDLAEKNDLLQETLACLINEIGSLKKTVKLTCKEPAHAMVNPENPLQMHQVIGNSTETITVDKLVTFLYGANPDFQYSLVLKHDLPLPLYRERNFKFTVMLTDKEGRLIENSNRIPVTIGIYSSENPPKFIDSNTAGNKILKGFIDKDIINGSVTFDKVQIKEVTSHFRNGWVFFVVYPKLTGNTMNNPILGSNGIPVNAQKIKPLILEKVVVKAKKAKEKEAGNEDEKLGDEDKMNEEEKLAEETKIEEEEKEMEEEKPNEEPISEEAIPEESPIKDTLST